MIPKRRHCMPDLFFLSIITLIYNVLLCDNLSLNKKLNSKIKIKLNGGSVLRNAWGTTFKKNLTSPEIEVKKNKPDFGRTLLKQIKFRANLVHFLAHFKTILSNWVLELTAAIFKHVFQCCQKVWAKSS